MRGKSHEKQTAEDEDNNNNNNNNKQEDKVREQSRHQGEERSGEQGEVASVSTGRLGSCWSTFPSDRGRAGAGGKVGEGWGQQGKKGMGIAGMETAGEEWGWQGKGWG
ncbi:hypothetical protein Pcinc_008468 [Petrolisthes cinctipes]|uniref:Uncharacterized protein n=1 Tax=Petrolisthes cinctipes TaxID=88211 RepID=A0AAE1G993_PETCI|nr:hypothetical protein Pcinc_008468 [Petrolisthes cinctipes]